MKKIKYIASGGLAFYEEKDMKMLVNYSKEGWILESFAGLGYKLRKGEPRHIEYSLDYQKDADEEYFTYFEDAGWSHVCSANEIHIFSAPEGSKPIYSDKTTIIEKYEREKKQMGKLALPFFITTVVLLVLNVMNRYVWASEAFEVITVLLGLVSLIILIFPGLPYIFYQYRLIKLRKL